MASISVKRTDSSDPDFAALVRKLDSFLSDHNGDQDEFFAQHNKIEVILPAVVAYDGDRPVGCGAFRPVDDQTVEIKRMFVEPDVRKQGVAQAVLATLERMATEGGHRAAVLETSRRLTSAQNLYRAAGYEPTPNYGPYVDVEDSVCFRKQIGG